MYIKKRQKKPEETPAAGTTISASFCRVSHKKSIIHGTLKDLLDGEEKLPELLVYKLLYN